MRSIYLTPVVLFFLASSAVAAGFAHNENFVVLAEDQALAEEVLHQAGLLRQRVARQWLGEELPPSIGPAVINVEISDGEDRGLTWAIDDPQRKYHKLWLTTSRERALGSTLAHEMTHIVLATRFPDRLPSWIDEGIASREDNPQRAETRRRILDWFAQTGNWPRLADVFAAEAILASDQSAYSVSASVTDYLLSLGDKPTLLKFAVSGKRNGWDHAIREHYRLGSVDQLQTAWQAWVARRAESTASAKLGSSEKPSSIR